RLAAAIGADDAEAVAADDADGEVGDDRALPEALGDSLGLEHEPAGQVGFGDGELDGADPALVLAPLAAQVGAPLQAADMALAAGGHAIGEPVLLAHDLAVELVTRRLLFLQHRVAPVLERAEAPVEPARDATVEPHGGAGQVGEEAPVVADDDEGRA